MTHARRNRSTLYDHLSAYDRLVEIGVGRRPALAATLARDGATVTATDIHDRAVPDPVAFVRDDICEPELSIYADADALYAQNLPPELHRPARDVARDVDADFLFTTLGGDQPAVPVDRYTVESGTLYVARSRQ